MIIDAYELTPLQAGMLVHAVSAPRSLAYHIQFQADLAGRVDPDRLHEAWTHLVERHHVLRSSFHWRGLDKPLQVVRPSATLPWRVEDWRTRTAEDQAQDWAGLIAQDQATPFDLERAPLMRIALIRRSDARWSLCWSHHHLLLDGWCLRPLLEELLARYAEPTHERAEPAQFGRYVRWLQQQTSADSERFWRETLAGFTAATPLPARDVTERRETEWADAICTGSIDANRTAALIALCRTQGVTLATALQAAWALVLARYSGEPDVVFGQTVAGRPPGLPGADAILGPFINTVPVRADVTATATVSAFLHALVRGQAQRDAHAHVALADIQRWSDVTPGTALFDSALIVQNFRPESREERDSAAFTIMPVALLDRTTLPLTIQFTPGETLEIECAYDSRRFDPAFIARVPGHLAQVLAAFVDAPEAALSSIELLTPPELTQLNAWNATDAPLDTNDTLLSAIRRWSLVTPEAIALRCGTTTVTYAELDACTDRLARTLQRRVPEIGPDHIVAMLTPRTTYLPLAILAAWKCGAAYVPIDPAYPPERIRTILADANPSAVFVQSGALDAALEREIAGQYTTLDIEEATAQQRPDDDAPLEWVTRGHDLAYVIYTSGSTGRPKGAMVEHTGLWNHLVSKAETLHLGPTDRIAQNASQAFDISVWQFFGALTVGATVVIYPEDTVLDGLAFLPRVQADGITVLELVPSYLNVLLDHEAAPVALPTLRWMLVTGEVVKPPLLARWFARYPEIPAVNAYGPSEAADDVTMHIMREAPDGPSVPIGIAVRNFHINICTPEGNRCPVGVPGELWVSGPGVGRGYLGDAERTAKTFGTDPFQPGHVRLYRTGDLACYQEDGTLLFIGRRDYQVKIRGHRIELGDVEAALVVIDGVSEAVVVDRRDDGREAWLAAYVTLQDGSSLTPDDILREVATRVPGYMVPATVSRLDALPLSPNGKVDRRRLPLVTPTHTESAEGRAPRTTVEHQLVGLWQDVLRRERVGIDENFFALGGDSLLAMQMVSRAARVGLALSPKDLFLHQSVAALAVHVRPIADTTTAATVDAGPAPVSEPQGTFLRDVTVDPHHHAQSVLLAIDAPLVVDAARAALDAVITRHASLRSRFTPTHDGWQVHTALSCTARWVTCETASAVHDTATALLASFDLQHGPLVGALHVHDASGTEQLLLAAHHLVVDGVSWRTLLEDFFTAYAQAQQGRAIDLPAPPARYTEWAQRTPASPLAHAARVPMDAGVVGDEAEVTVVLSGALADTLARDAQRVLLTDPMDLIVTAVAAVMTAWRGDDTYTLSIESHGRGDDGRFADTVGWFTRTLVIDAAGLNDSATRAPERWVTSAAMVKERRRDADARPSERVRAAVQVNYHGRVDDAFPAPWRLLPDTIGHDRSLRQPRLHPFDVTALVTAAGFELRLQYDGASHAAAAMQSLVVSIGDALTSLAESLVTARPRFTVSDVPAAKLSSDDLVVLHEAGLHPGVADDVFTLSPTQQGMLFHAVDEPDSEMYVNQLTCIIDAPLDVTAFVQAWQRVTARHAALRTSFHWERLPHPVQIVHADFAVPHESRDWRARSSDEQDVAWQQLCDADRARGFDLTRPPLQRVLLARTGETRYRFCWTQHHLLLDGWSAAIVLDEVLGAYLGRAFDDRRPRRYRDAVVWIEQQEREQLAAFWRDRLADRPAVTPLPAGRPLFDGATTPFACREVERVLSASVSAAVRQLAERERLTLSSIMQGAWALALARQSGERDVIFGAVVGGRPTQLDGADEMIGVFINTVPVRVTIDEDEPIGSWLRALQTRQVESEPFQYGALAEIQRWSGAGAGAPLFDTLLNVANYSVSASLQAPGSEFAVREVRAWEPNNYPLTLVVTPGPCLTLTLLYDAGRYDVTTVNALLARLEQLLATMAVRCDRPVAELHFITAEETQALLGPWNATARPVPSSPTVWHAIAAHADATPDRVAVRARHATLTYRELVQAVDARAQWLSAQGAAGGDRVIVELPRDEQLIVTMLACWRMSAIYVPIDPAWPEARRALVTSRVQATVHVTSVPPASTTDDLPRHTWREPAPDDLAYIIHTSGSTGVPKGALLAHDGLLNHVTSMIEDLGLTPRDVVAQTASQGFDISLWQMCAALVAGGTTSVFDDRLVLDPPAMIEALVSDRVTVMQCVPSYLRVLLDTDSVADLALTLRWIVTIGEALSPSLVTRWFTVCPRVPFMNAYGPTEASDSVTHHVFREPPSSPVVPLGRPIRNMACYVLDGRGQLCAPGAVGEIAIAGIGVGRGYLFDDERTAAAFTNDPFVPGRRLYRTGDLGTFAFDGTLRFLGRRDGQVKIRGHRLEIGEVETALGALPGIREAVVIVRTAEGRSPALEACVVSSDDREWTLTRLVDALALQLPRYAIPERLHTLAVLPRLSSGKIDRGALSALSPVDRAAGSAPEANLPEADPSTASLTPAEQLVRQAWQEILGHDAIARDSDFFALGGHSLHALQLVGRLSRDSGIRLELRDIFALPTVQGQATLIERGVPSLVRPIEPVPDADDYPVSPAQRRLWLASRTPEGSQALHMIADFRVHGLLRRDALHDALSLVLARHESLRTTFLVRAGAVRQRVQAHVAADAVLTWHASTPADVAAVTTVPFSLDHGPLLRLHVWPETPTTHRVLAVLHHVIGDAVSLRVLFDDLLEAYAAVRDHRAPAWESLSVQARDVAAWQAAQAVTTSAADEAYWRRTMLPLPAPVPLPLAATGQPAEVQPRTMTLDDITVASMRTLASAHATTVFALLTAAVGGALHRLTGMEALVVGTQLSRRQHPLLQRQVGLLIDSLPLSLEVLPGDQSDALLRRVTRSVRHALTHGSIGFDRLLDLLDVPVISGRTPLFDVVVQYITTDESHRPATHVASGLEVNTVETESPFTAYILSVEGSDGPGGTIVLQVTANAMLSTEFLDLFMARLPDVITWLTAGNESPLSSLPIAAAPRPTRSRIALMLS